MSQDLFAAFANLAPNDTSKTGSTTQNAASLSFFDDLKPSVPVTSNSLFTPAATLFSQPSDAAEDDWGDFEAADSAVSDVVQSLPAPATAPSRHEYSLDDLGPSKPTAKAQDSGPAKSFSFGHEFGSFENEDLDGPTAFSNDSNVLFDANDDYDDDGDFGDFEGPQEIVAPVIQKTTEVDLLGLEDEVIVQPAPKKAIFPTVKSKQSSISFGSTTNVKAIHSEPKEPVETPEEDEPWDDFSAWDKDAAETKQPAREAVELNLTSAIKPIQGTEDPSNTPDDAVPPTNIPPPALLLSIFPSIFQQVETELLKPAAAQSLTVRQEIYSDPKTVQYLKGYVAILTVFARILAGRKLRWKRDTLLAQSMRIGSASAGRVSGMKVTSIDKTELKKEDGEAAEALAVWSTQSGRVKTAVNEARRTHTELSVVPELKEVMPVKVIKEIDGGITSAKSCALCGLKREERIAKVDIDVMDSFGEWWVERTSMHRGRSLSPCVA